MRKLLSWSLWLAGMLALLAALNDAIGIVSLDLQIAFIRIDFLHVIIAFICFFNAYLQGEPRWLKDEG